MSIIQFYNLTFDGCEPKFKFFVMGNSFFCERCDIKKYNLSRPCVDENLSDGRKLSAEEHWHLKLKCLDDAHSRNNDLTQDAFNELIETLEKKLSADSTPVYCKNRDMLMKCLERNSNCMINCKGEIDNFIDCVDTMRIRKMKEKTLNKT